MTSPNDSQLEKETDSSLAPLGRVLVVDDEKNIRATVKMVLNSEGFRVDTAEDGNKADEILSTTPPDAILLDVRMPGRTGLELLKTWRVQYPEMPIILMSGEATLSEAVGGLKDGAFDFLEKPLMQARLCNTVRHAIDRSKQLEKRAATSPFQIIGRSPALARVLGDIEKIAPTKTRVLITGESGTGKDLLARALHSHSGRKTKPFIKVNCAAIPSELIESELFGHKKGAFTGALNARRGYFEAANGGTLFLDEIGELSASAQAKILRAIQNGEITPVGSDVTVQVDVRIVAATNRDLKAEVELGNFREDLFYRLAVVVVESPRLKDRKEDIPLLVQFFAEDIRKENGLGSKNFDAAVMQILQEYNWPGNIRELRNVVERLLILSGPVITVNELPTELRQPTQNSSTRINQALGQPEFSLVPWESFKKESERNYLIFALRTCKGNISETARVLGVERTTIHKWMHSYQIQKQHFVE